MKLSRHPWRKAPESPYHPGDDFIDAWMIYKNFKEEIWDRCVAFRDGRRSK
jgi:hypothetical protein